MQRKLRMLSMLMALLLVFLCIPVAALENVTTGGPMTTQEINGMNASTDNSRNLSVYERPQIYHCTFKGKMDNRIKFHAA